jgi:hypothetical protein
LALTANGKINLYKIQNVIFRNKNKYTYCIASNEYVLYIQFIQTTPATPGNRNNAQLAGFKAKVKR